MSPESIITSVKSEQRWLRETGHNFNHLSRIVNMPLCVFKVPKKLSDAKPEAYIPRRLGLGPYHHLRPEFHAINKRKLVAIRNSYPPEIIQNIRLLVGYLVKLEADIRAYYDQFLDLDIEKLAWIIAIDGLYLLQYLKKYPEMKDVAGDVLMLENQIPVELLTAVHRFVKLVTCGKTFLSESIQAVSEGRSPPELSLTDDEPVLWSGKEISFLLDHSPLELDGRGAETNYDHVLHLMHSMIVSKRVLPGDVDQGAQFLAERGVPGAGTTSQVLSVATAIPWEKISGMFKKDGPDPDPSVTVDEIDIPSVTQMTEVAGIKFVLTKGGIRDVRFGDGGGVRIFYLPSIRITATTEVVLRNLVAFEELVSAEQGAKLELAEYVDLMCGIIDTRRDVEILREAGIVRGDMDDDEIVRIFNGINRSEKEEEKSGVEKLANCTMLTLQAYCTVFGCSRWFGKSSS